MGINLIGISGWIGSGKDLFAKMLQIAIYCSVSKDKGQIEFLMDRIGDKEFWDKKYRVTNKNTSWEIKKFATPLKEIACILLGCTMEQLEDQEFKKSELGSEWSKPSILSKEEFEKLPKRKDGEPNYYIYDKKITVREFLQKLGTEAIRNQIHDNAWVNAMFSKYKEPSILDRKGLGEDNDKSKWIITDLRFPNEAKAIKDRGGICIRMHREEGLFNPPNSSRHSSETVLDNYIFDAYIQNTSTLEDLYRWAVGIVNQYKLS